MFIITPKFMRFSHFPPPAFLLNAGLCIGLMMQTATAFAQMGSGMMPTIMSNAYTQNVVSGHALNYHATATGSPAMTYQWQVSTNNGISWANLMDDFSYSGTATDILSITSAAMSMSGYQYRMVAANTAGSAISAAFTMNVMAGVLTGPAGLAFDPAGNCWISDGSTNVIQKMTPAGLASIMVGISGQQGATNGAGTAATFRMPGGMVIDSAGNVYVADTGNSLIRMISPIGVVTTVAGSAAHQEYKDGIGTDAWFNVPTCLALDANGNIYVADTGNSVIRMITPSGVVSTLAGTAGMKGTTDGIGAAARFNQPAGIALDSAGMIYVADTMNQTIRKITPSGAVTTMAGLMGMSGTNDGNRTSALFNQPMGLTFDRSGNLYVADYGNSAIRMVAPTGVVSTLAGLNSISGMMDGMGAATLFNMPKDVKFDGTSTLYVADYGNAEIRKVSLQGAVSTMAISESFTSGSNGTTSSGGSSTTPPTNSGNAGTTSSGGTFTATPNATSSGGGGGAVSFPFLSALVVVVCVRFLHRRNMD